MKYRKLWILALPVILLTACQKNLEDSFLKKEGSATSMNSSAPTFSYGASIFFLKPSGATYNILPKVKPNVPGVFKSIPKGLALDSVTGRININRSLSGLKYKVYYTGPGSLLLDSTSLVISGIDYADSIYVLNNTPNAYDTAFPIYNANKNLALPCGSGDDDNENLCVFDETDLNNDGNDDIAGVNQQKLLVNEKTGTIDVEASFHAGIFGSSNPANGTRKDFKFFYRLNDASGRALNNITVRVFYYNKKSDVPASLIRQIRDRKWVDQRVNLSPLPGQTMLNIEESAYIMDFASYTKPRRPPIIVIIGQQ
jgi:hypothetical protein